MVRQGYYERYFITPFFRKFSDFKGSESKRDLSLTLLTWCVATLGISGLLIGLVGLLGPETGFIVSAVLGALWILWSILPLLALFARAGRGGEAEPTPNRGMLPIDKMLGVVCILFFVFGLLMMITTLNSEDLNLDRKNYVSDEENPILNQDKVVEEAIFNYSEYQIEDAAEEVPVDTVSHETELGTEHDGMESFDPAAATPAAQDTTYIE